MESNNGLTRKKKKKVRLKKARWSKMWASAILSLRYLRRTHRYPLRKLGT